jgi:catechol 2,3-dioxygenase-like lactoylglutathione lyase family enzyme
MNHSSVPRLSGAMSAALLIVMSVARADGIPSIVGVDHIGMTVPKLQDGIDFFTKVLGCQYVYTAGPFADPKGKWMETNLAVDAGASTTLAMVRCGPTQNIELFEYDAKDQVKTPMKNSDVGGFHLAFYVTDLKQAVDYLKNVPGVQVLGDPTPVSGQPNGGETFVYFKTPWGANMELLTYPRGLDYEKTTDKRLFGVMKQ